MRGRAGSVDDDGIAGDPVPGVEAVARVIDLLEPQVPSPELSEEPGRPFWMLVENRYGAGKSGGHG
jgi:hypothetical protein